MIPILLKPKVIAFSNRWRTGIVRKSQLGRDLAIGTFSLLIMFSIYKLTVLALERISANIDIAYFPPSLPLGLVFLFLLAMLLLSSAVTALGTFFLNHDLNLLLTSPIKISSFFWGKYLEVFFSASWMALVFGMPLILGFAVFYQAPLSFYLATTLLIIPYFVIPTALATALVIAFTRLVPINRTKEVMIFLCMLLIVGAYSLLQLLDIKNSSVADADDLLRIVALLSLPNTNWVPSFWLAASLGELLEGAGLTFWSYVVLLYAGAIGSASLAYLSVRLLYEAAYSRSNSGSGSVQIQNRIFRNVVFKLTPFIPDQYRAVVSKEYKLFTRDMAQAIQLLLLLGICIVYLYNFRLLHSVEGLPENTRLWWQGFLLISNLAMGAFVIAAICTRFVFPSISLEGQSYWLFQNAPMTIRDILYAKFFCWFIPVGLISSVIFVSGSFAINSGHQIILINCFASWIISYGIVGLAVGFGSLFARFDWEHPSQLAASFGSLIFMLFSSGLIFLNILPITLLIVLGGIQHDNPNFPPFHWYSVIIGTLAIMTYLNICSTRWALKLGEKSLLEKQDQ